MHHGLRATWYLLPFTFDVASGVTVQMVDVSCLSGDGASVLPNRKCVFEQLDVATLSLVQG